MDSTCTKSNRGKQSRLLPHQCAKQQAIGIILVSPLTEKAALKGVRHSGALAFSAIHFAQAQYIITTMVCSTGACIIAGWMSGDTSARSLRSGKHRKYDRARAQRVYTPSSIHQSMLTCSYETQHAHASRSLISWRWNSQRKGVHCQ